MAITTSAGQVHLSNQSILTQDVLDNCQSHANLCIHSSLEYRARWNVSRTSALLRRPPELPHHVRTPIRHIRPVRVRRSLALPSSQPLRPLAAASSDPSQTAERSTPSSSQTHFENQPPPIYPTAEQENPGPSGHPGFIFFAGDSRVGTVSYNPQATVQGTPAPEQETGEPPNMAIWTNLPPKRLLLMAVLAGTLWTSLMGVRVFGRGARLAAGAVSLVWLGIVLGISFLEAWVS